MACGHRAGSLSPTHVEKAASYRTIARFASHSRHNTNALKSIVVTVVTGSLAMAGPVGKLLISCFTTVNVNTFVVPFHDIVTFVTTVIGFAFLSLSRPQNIRSNHAFGL